MEIAAGPLKRRAALSVRGSCVDERFTDQAENGRTDEGGDMAGLKDDSADGGLHAGEMRH
jgi:hypothetical protein